MRAGRSPQAAGALTAALYVEHGRMVLGLCRLLLRDPFDAEDAAQQAFVNAHQALLHGGRVRRPAQCSPRSHGTSAAHGCSRGFANRRH